ncbi:TetR/AcrR family transcriptional regulator [Lentibacillus sp. CBA3610]|uniref:TetR/AcrR family transcriptional regulator n=1 Tax=Lentibacillus sp. CBA3610 TaxID=2518176 RepID=UPI001595B910|nr:TetR/AcrR family transcriptional regulator [Lentibacillus sp. CBA3610]QKY68372.1 TetR/AcrR family transcriptional regulator [Lentibacillus sp. CBA3610]
MAKPKSNEKREAIFQTGLKLFAENGYSKTTIKDIAQEAGVSFGTVFTYYENKAALLRACVTEPLQEFRQHMLAAREELESMTFETFNNLVDRHIGLFMEKEQYLRVVQYVIGQPERFDEMEVLDEFADEFRSFTKSIVETGMDKGFLPESNPEEVSYGYLAFLMGMRLSFTDHSKSHQTSTFKNQALRLFGIQEVHQ